MSKIDRLCIQLQHMFYLCHWHTSVPALNLPGYIEHRLQIYLRQINESKFDWQLWQLQPLVVIRNPSKKPTKEFVTISHKMPYRKISHSLKAVRFMFRMVWSLWNLTGISPVLILRRPSNLEAIWYLKLLILRFRSFMISYDRLPQEPIIWEPPVDRESIEKVQRTLDNLVCRSRSFDGGYRWWMLSAPV